MADAAALLAPPVLITQDHDAASFDSGEPALDNWLRQRALANLRSAASRTYVACPSASKSIAGYFALSMGQILASETTGSMRRNLPAQVPAVLLGRLAIDRKYQGRGLGKALLADAVRRTELASSQVSARLIVVHAISVVAEQFYIRNGFTRLPVETPTLALDLIKWRAPESQ